MVISECYCLVAAATTAATAGQVFHCPDFRNDSRARTELLPPANTLRAHLEFASPRCPGAEGWRDGVSGPLLTTFGGVFSLISAGISVPRSRPRERYLTAAPLPSLPGLGLVRDVLGFVNRLGVLGL